MDMGTQIKTILIEDAKKCKMKTKKQPKSSDSSAPWFDGQCIKTKNPYVISVNNLKGRRVTEIYVKTYWSKNVFLGKLFLIKNQNIKRI